MGNIQVDSLISLLVEAKGCTLGPVWKFVNYSSADIEAWHIVDDKNVQCSFALSIISDDKVQHKDLSGQSNFVTQMGPPSVVPVVLGLRGKGVNNKAGRIHAEVQRLT